MEWNPAQYLRFNEERTRAVRELVARLQHHLPLPGPRRIVDLGCGPGNSTAVLAAAWPQAEILGLDASDTMLAAAREAHPGLRFAAGDIAEWASGAAGAYDLVFSNSALQWVDDHARLLPRLLAQVAPDAGAGLGLKRSPARSSVKRVERRSRSGSRANQCGALAFQVPASWDAPVGALARELAAEPAWRKFFAGGAIREWHSQTLAFYHDVLAPHAAALDLWETEYVMIVPDAEAIAAWYKGSGLRPYLQALPDDSSRAAFEQQYLAALRLAYPPQPNGQVIFPFRRRFVIALADNRSSA